MYGAWWGMLSERDEDRKSSQLTLCLPLVIILVIVHKYGALLVKLCQGVIHYLSSLVSNVPTARPNKLIANSSLKPPTTPTARKNK
jgi:hypothetical protein